MSESSNEEEYPSEKIKQRTWEEFQESGLLWWVNRTLHLFGWVIVYEVAQDGSCITAYPARTSFRGFDEQTEDNGFHKLTRYIVYNASKLLDEVNS